jgi:hypothetical protein
LFDLQKMIAVKHAEDGTFIEFHKVIVQAAHTLKTIDKAQKPRTPRNPNGLNKPNELQRPSPAGAV